MQRADASRPAGNRLSIFEKLARMHHAEEEKKRKQRMAQNLEATSKQPEPQSASVDLWPNSKQEAEMTQEQLTYAEPYQKMYQVSSVSSVANSDADSGEPHHQNQNGEPGCSVQSVISDNDTVGSLPTISGRRGRAWMKRLAMNNNGVDRNIIDSAKSSADSTISSSMVDFNEVSTIQAPTEIADYTSNLSADDVKKDFFVNYKFNTELPIFKQRSYLINCIRSYSVVIIEGATGCGKTTQVPMYIIEDAIIGRGYTGKAPLVYVTQPRRIAAKSIAQRVCNEHGWDIGSLVGYQVGLEKNISSRTILVYCTAGVLLQKIIAEKSLANYTHIIIDEAHERDADTDLLLMKIRLLMQKENSFLKLVVMSATMDLGKLKNYWTFRTEHGHRAVTTPSIVKIEGKEPNKIQVIYMEKLFDSFQIVTPVPTFDFIAPELHDECLFVAKSIIIDVIPKLDTYSGATESTLVFLPGLAEIAKLHRMLKGHEDYLDVIPLHSTISSSDQNRVFLRARDGCRKVILATNIAESSITVKDVGFIIDFCLTKTLRKDGITNFPSLKLQWSTVDKSIQRAGRTGRCCPGKVFRMVTSSFFKTFRQYAEPELLTSPLESSVLRVKSFNMGEVKALLAVVLDPPKFSDIRDAVLELKQIGALSSTYEGKLSDMDGDLTELGKIISKLPIDVHLGKLLVIASLLDVLEPAIVVAACLSTNRSVVKNLFEDKLKTYKDKLDWSNGSESDLIVCLEVFKNYIAYKDARERSDRHLEQFCLQKNLDEKKLHEVSALVDELKTRLGDINLRLYNQPNRQRNEAEDELMLKIAFCASFYPNYFVNRDMDPQDTEKCLRGADPTKTVILHNFPVNQVPLYRSQVVKQLRDKGISSNLDFYSDTSRALLVFNDEEEMLRDEMSELALRSKSIIQPTKTAKRVVYEAVKISEQIQNKILIKEYREEVGDERMYYYRERKQDLDETISGRLLPSLMKIVEGRPADNSWLYTCTDEEYYQVWDRHNYIEVEINGEQDRADQRELINLEIRIEQCKAKKLEELPDYNHPIYKQGFRAIRGPNSPIEMSFRCLLNRSSCYRVVIDPVSVNSIVLNPEYKVPRRQMMVAASVCQSNVESRIIAHDTTLMPNIRGLPTLMALMFAQYYRVVYNDQTKCIIGGIFGIGWDEDDEPIDCKYQVELGFDVHITKYDINMINSVRQTISKLIKFTDVEDAGGPRAQLQQELRDLILTVIKRRRCPIEEADLCTISCREWDWKEYFVDKHNVPVEQLESLPDGQTRPFLPLMQITRKYTELDMFQAIRKNLDQLDKIANCLVRVPIDGIRCFLCGSDRDNFYMMQTKINDHVFSASHRSKLEEFEKAEERAKISAGLV